jgi:hypothetical protein
MFSSFMRTLKNICVTFFWPIQIQHGVWITKKALQKQEQMEMSEKVQHFS